MYNAYITRLTNVRKHPNADRLQLGECFGNTVCVNLDYENNQLGIYFPTDGQLSEAFCAANNLVRKKDAEGNSIGGYMDPDKRNITAIRLRGEKSDGLFLPLESLASFGDISQLKEGDNFSIFNGVEICTKYIPKRRMSSAGSSGGNRTRKKKVAIAPLFSEHADTEQLAYNLDAFRPGDEIEITLKMHGTSQRTGYLPVFKGYQQDFWGKLLNYINPDKKMKPFVAKLYEKAIRNATPIYEYGYVSGTRRVVLDSYDGGFYGSNEFRESHSKVFEGKLWKGETVYYEVVGFTHTGAPIMGNGNNKKLNDKEFIKQYGEETVFSYGCTPTGKWGKGITETDVPQSDIYVYRMTMTNEDGNVVEYTPNFMRYRCEQMGVKTVPMLWEGKISENLTTLYGDVNVHEYIAGEWIKEVAEEFYDGPDPIGKTHVREGVVVRIVNRPKFTAYKHKNFSFKVLEGIIKAEAETADMEEAQEEVAE